MTQISDTSKSDECNNPSNGTASPPVEHIAQNGYNNNNSTHPYTSSPTNMAYKKSFRIEALLGKNQNSFEQYDENEDNVSDHKYISVNDGLLKYDDDNKDYDMSPEDRLSR
jgi:hypothetical protein